MGGTGKLVIGKGGWEKLGNLPQAGEGFWVLT